MVIIIKTLALLKTQHINTESFPQNLLLCQATLTKMQEFKLKLFTIKLLQDRLGTFVAYFHTAKHTSIKILFTKKTQNKPTNEKNQPRAFDTYSFSNLIVNSSKNITFTDL